MTAAHDLEHLHEDATPVGTGTKHAASPGAGATMAQGSEGAVDVPDPLLELHCVHVVGHQDMYVSQKPYMAGVLWGHRALLDPSTERYGMSYGAVPLTRSTRFSDVMTLDINRFACDALCDVDLVLSNPAGQFRVGHLLASVEVEVGGQRFDKWGFNDDADAMTTHVEAVTALFGRRIEQIGDKLVVPLVLAPFNGDVVFPLVSLKYHAVSVNVRLQQLPFEPPELWGKRVMLSDQVRRSVSNARWEAPLYQTQYTGAQRYTATGPVLNGIVTGMRTHEHVLHFNHPMHVLFVWGLDAALIKRVRICINRKVALDVSPAMLEMAKRKRGLHCDAMAVFISDDALWAPSRSTLNASRIDRLTLEIDTAQDTPADVHVVGINLQIVVATAGMMGLKYSK